MKTIAQIAAEIGVSKQAVHKKMKQEPLSTSLRRLTSTIGNAVVVSVDGEKLIKQAFSGSKSSTSTTNSTTEMVVEVDDFINENDNQLTANLLAQVDLLTEQNRDLREQLNEERKHSREQANQIIELAQNMAQLAQNAQQLHLGDMIPRLSSNADSTEGIQEEPKEKRGIFQRIFSKK